MSEPPREPVYTTFEAARFCGVFHTTVLHWIRKGKLNAYATPGGHHRIPRSALLAFMERYDFPVPGDLEATNPRVLVIDDDPGVAPAIARSLSAAKVPCEVAAAGDPVRGLIEVGRRLPDLLVLDLRMPIMDGAEVCRILKASPVTSGIKIVAVTDSEAGSERAALLKSRADAFLRKPLEPEKLAETVRGLLD